MIDVCANDETIKKLLSGTEYQVSTIWKDKETGLICKSRPDICQRKKSVIVDIKTTLDASPQGFARQAANLNYPIQAITQITGAIESGLMPSVDNYFWLAVEKTPPYNHALYEFQQTDIEYYSDALGYYLNRCAHALKLLSNADGDLSRVPSYGESSDNKYGIIQLDLPLWYRGNY